MQSLVANLIFPFVEWHGTFINNVVARDDNGEECGRPLGYPEWQQSPLCGGKSFTYSESRHDGVLRSSLQLTVLPSPTQTFNGEQSTNLAQYGQKCKDTISHFPLPIFKRSRNASRELVSRFARGREDR